MKIKYITDYSDGGIVLGKSHEEGGVPTYAKGRLIAEIEGGELILPSDVSKRVDALVARYLEEEDEGVLKQIGIEVYSAVRDILNKMPLSLKERMKKGKTRKIKES
ncbi:MAG: hypothetical protein KatS3mg031_2803 [Chitinophagales bacterium]|jgi:hypothetical protein|nr:MAG: hypothetical protein KatS3mg031_2803 [Chitinophagales bacterium]